MKPLLLALGISLMSAAACSEAPSTAQTTVTLPAERPATASASVAPEPVAEPPIPPTSTSPQRLHFAPGAISLQVRGRLTDPHRDAEYVFDARAGQHVLLHTSTLPLPARDAPLTMVPQAFLLTPKGDQHGDKGPIPVNETLTETGDYRIRVARNLMASNRDTGAFLLEVVVY